LTCGSTSTGLERRAAFWCQFYHTGINVKVKRFIIITVASSLFSCNGKTPPAISKIQIDTASGIYVSINDRKHSIEIKDNKYYMHYEGIKTSPDSIFKMEIVDTIKNNGTVYSSGKYLRLTNDNEIMEYAINSWNNETISLTYLPGGNTLTYKKKE